MCGSRLCPLVILLLALSRIIALLLCLFVFLKFLLLVLEFGSSIYLFLKNDPLLFPVSGLVGVLRSPDFSFWLSGGIKGKVSLRDLLLDIDVFVLLSGHNTVASCLAWQTT